MDEKQLLAAIEKAVKDAATGMISQKDLDLRVKSLNDEIAKLTSEKIDELAGKVEKLTKDNENLVIASKAQGEELTKLKMGNSTEVTPKTFAEAIKAAVLAKKDLYLKEVSDDNGKRLSFKDYFSRNRSTGTIEIDKAVDMLQSNIVGNYVANLRLTQLDPMRVGIPLVQYPHALDVIPIRPIQKPYMAMLVVGTYVDGAATKTEGNAATQSSFLLTTQSFTAFNIATYFTLSDETLDDLEEVMAEIATVAPDKLNAAIDAKIFADAGNGSSDIRGLFVNAATCTDFVAATYGGTVIGANLIDLIDKMKLNIQLENYNPDVVGLNDVDLSKFRGLKDQLDNSIMDRRVTYNAMGDVVSICGLAVIRNNKITADTCFVGDSKQYQIGLRKGMSMEIGLNAADFTEFQKTVRLSVRLAFGVRDKAAFQYCAAMATDTNTIATV
jgi:hypothetical protein